MRLSSAGFSPEPPEGEKRVMNSELWHACAGPLVSLPQIGSRVIYFPQGHSEQVAASTNRDVDAHIPNYPSLPPQLICQLHNVTMHADVETDKVYAQMTLQPLSPEEQKEAYLPADFGTPNKQPTNYFCKTLTASDTSTHGGFSVPRRAAEKVFPPLDFSQQPPAQELIARDLHDNEWKFRHIFRGQPKRHLLTTGWSVFVSAKRLIAGDSVLFIWNEKNQLLLGIRRANRPQMVMPSSVLSCDSMQLGLLAAAAHAAATNSRFNIFYNPRASPSEFIIPLAKYVKAVYHTRVSVGMRFRMLFETEESSVRRYMGTITGIGDLDPARWSNSHWRSVKVGWDESAAGDRQPRVSLWEIEPLTTFPMYPSPFSLRLKRPWPPGSPSFQSLKEDDIGMISPLMWLRGDNADRGFQSLNFQGMEVTPWMQPRFDPSMLGLQNDMYQIMAASALQNVGSMDPFKQASTSLLQFQQNQNLPNQSITLMQSQMLQQSQHQQSFIQNVHDNQNQSHSQSQTPSCFVQQQLQRQHSFRNQQEQHLEQQPAELVENSQITTAVPLMTQFASASQSNSTSSQTITSVCPQQTYSSSSVNPVKSPTISNFYSLLGSFPHDESSQLLNLPRTDPSIASADWQPSKRAAGEQLFSSGTHHFVTQLDQMVVPRSNSSPNTVSLPPLPGKDCSVDPEGSNDPRNSVLFGVNIESSSQLMHSGMPTLRGVGNNNDTTNLSPGTPGYMSASGSEFLFNTSMTPSACINESGFLQSQNAAQINLPNGTYVKVYKSGSCGRSLDISKFNSYHELRSELAHMFGLEGPLEDPLRSGWQLVFVDQENDVLLLGDDPWPEFVNSVWCIKILSPQEVQELGKQGLELLNSVPTQKLADSCDDYTSRQDSRNLSTGLMALGSLDY